MRMQCVSTCGRCYLQGLRASKYAAPWRWEKKLVKFKRLYRDSLKVGDWFVTVPKTNMEGPKMMVWKRLIPFKNGNFWYPC